MFRLVSMLEHDTDTVVYAHGDGYSNEPAAWAGYCADPAGLSGIGHHDADGRLVDLVLDRVLDADDSVARCDRIAGHLGARVRTVPMALRPHAAVDVAAVQRLVAGIEADLPRRLRDPSWRQLLCQDLAVEPLALAGVVNAVRRLPHWAVLDGYPHLQDLAAGLPVSIRTELRRHIGDRVSNTGVTALRLGL